VANAAHACNIVIRSVDVRAATLTAEAVAELLLRVALLLLLASTSSISILLIPRRIGVHRPVMVICLRRLLVERGLRGRMRVVCLLLPRRVTAGLSVCGRILIVADADGGGALLLRVATLVGERGNALKRVRGGALRRPVVLVNGHRRRTVCSRKKS
jgi:hypothetical protein